jgi:hypothetical protein
MVILIFGLPESQVTIPNAPLILRTAHGTYFIQLIWNQVSYGFKVTSLNGSVVADLKIKRLPDGAGIQTIEVPSPGPYTIEVNVEAVAGSPMGIFIESARFGIIVEE